MDYLIQDFFASMADRWIGSMTSVFTSGSGLLVAASVVAGAYLFRKASRNVADRIGIGIGPIVAVVVLLIASFVVLGGLRTEPTVGPDWSPLPEVQAKIELAKIERAKNELAKVERVRVERSRVEAAAAREHLHARRMSEAVAGAGRRPMTYAERHRLAIRALLAEREERMRQNPALYTAEARAARLKLLVSREKDRQRKAGLAAKARGERRIAGITPAPSPSPAAGTMTVAQAYEQRAAMEEERLRRAQAVLARLPQADRPPWLVGGLDHDRRWR